MSWFSKKQEETDVQVGDIISFQDADNPALGHGHDVIGFDEKGNPLVECDGETLTVKPEQIEHVFFK